MTKRKKAPQPLPLEKPEPRHAKSQRLLLHIGADRYLHLVDPDVSVKEFLQSVKARYGEPASVCYVHECYKVDERYRVGDCFEPLDKVWIATGDEQPLKKREEKVRTKFESVLNRVEQAFDSDSSTPKTKSEPIAEVLSDSESDLPPEPVERVEPVAPAPLKAESLDDLSSDNLEMTYHAPAQADVSDGSLSAGLSSPKQKAKDDSLADSSHSNPGEFDQFLSLNKKDSFASE